MEFRIDQEVRPPAFWLDFEKISLTITIIFTREEHYALSQANAWNRAPLGKFSVTVGLLSTKSFSPKYYEFISPGLLIGGFEKWAASSFEKKFISTYEPRIRQDVSGMLRKFLVEQRDAAFKPQPLRPVIDVSPGAATGQGVAGPFPAYMGAPFGIPPYAKPRLDNIPRKTFSTINLADLVKERLAPSSPLSVPPVHAIQAEFLEPDDENDHRVRLLLALPAEDVALIYRWGLDKHHFETEPLFDDEAIEQLQWAQEQEIIATADPHIIASLKIEHKEQLAYAREEKIGRTIADYMAYPYTEYFTDRYQATNRQRKLQSVVIEIKKMLDQHRDR